jgi:hypothetical protein
MTTAELKNSTPEFKQDRHLIAGRYHTHTRIGHGRLGEIFAAIDKGYEELGVEQQVAIQVIPDSVARDNQLFNKINSGYAILRAAAHPNIVDFLHFGRDAKFGFLVMELLDGLSLRSVLDGAEVLALDEAKPVIRGVGEALRLLHAKNMVHGNLTTSNVFITEELKVRLLDVLPLNSSETIIHDAATSAPFSRCTFDDDVFALACLTYEMLAGIHPFNYSSFADARSAGLEAEHIASLPDREWNAVRRALSFDDDQRTSSIADFMYDFGVSNVERLRPAMDEPAEQKPNVYLAEEATPPMTRLAVPAQSTAAIAPVVAANSASRNEVWPRKKSPTTRGARLPRLVFLGMLLAGVSGRSFYGQPQEQVLNWIGYIDETFNVGLVERSNRIVEIQTPDPGRSASMDRVAPGNDSTVTAPAAGVTAPLADFETQHSEPELTELDEGIIPVAEQSTDQPAPAYPLYRRDTTGTIDEETIREEDGVLTDTDVEPMRAEPESVLVASVLSVSERDGAARIAAPRSENSATPLLWWTSEHTANAGKDFIFVEQQTVADASFEDNNILLIPLVNDNLPEPQESFYVNFGLRNSQQGRIDRIATVRVDISDDDFP